MDAEKVKKALALHIESVNCTGCPYYDNVDDCSIDLALGALELIEQLEEQNAVLEERVAIATECKGDNG